MSLVLDVNGLSIRMAHSLRKTPTCEGRGGRLPFAETPVVPTPYSGETDGVLSATALGSVHGERVRHRLAGEAGFPSPKGGDIRGRYWRPAEVRAWARRWAKNARGGS